MANEFVARNGVIAKNNSTISGSFTITGSQTITGPFTQNASSTASFGGIVGIGTLSPSSIFHINYSNTDYTNTLGTNSHIVLNNSGTSGQIAVSFINNGRLTGKIRNDYTGNMNYVTSGSGNHYFFTQGDFGIGSTKLTISSSGDIGIGTTTPVSKLHVSGTLTIDGDWNNNSTNGLHLAFISTGSNATGSIYSLQNGTAWRSLNIDGSELRLNSLSGGTIFMPYLTDGTPGYIVGVDPGGGGILYRINKDSLVTPTDVEDINTGTQTGQTVIRPENLEQSKYTTINIFNFLNFS